MDPTTADFNAWLAEEGAKVGATVLPQGPPDNFLRGYGQGYQVDLGTDSAYDPTTADILAKAQAGGAFPNWLRSMAPTVAPADDSSAWSGVTSRLARTGTGLVHGALNTTANWLDQKPEIGPDTIAPLGLAPMGMALTPRNAIGSAGGKLASSLPMDEASRLNRAREMGFDTDNAAYRGLSRPYDDAEASRLYYQMFTSSPAEAAEYAMGNPLARPNVVPAYLRKGRNLEVDASNQNFNAVPTSALPDDIRAKLRGDVARTDEIAHAARGLGYDSVTIKNVIDNATNEVIQTPKENPAMKAKRAAEMDAILAELGDLGDLPPAPAAVSRGYEGVAPHERGPVTVNAVFDPKNIRSKYAAFNPLDSDKAGLLLSDQSKASLPGTVVNSVDQANASTRAATGLGHPDAEPVIGTRQQAKAPGAEPSITAYHGSPHDFDRFDTTKIGTGEGAQAYGHGLYFAENEGVARSYQEALGKPNLYDPTTKVHEYLKTNSNKPEYALESLQRDRAKLAMLQSGPEFTKPYDDAIAILSRHLKDGEPLPERVAPGRMYEVRIKADPESFLDWDKPLAQQPAHVLDALGLKIQSSEGNYNMWEWSHGGRTYTGEVGKGARPGTVEIGGKSLGDLLGDSADTAKSLSESGIPGIKYKDAGSRGQDGAGTRNYVVFDADKIEILKKYGWVPAGMVGGGMMMTPPEGATLPKEVQQ